MTPTTPTISPRLLGQIALGRLLMLGVLTGLFMFIATPGSGTWVFVWFGLVPLLVALDHPRTKMSAAFAVAWVSGTIVHATAHAWLIVTIQQRQGSGLLVTIALWLLIALSLGAAWGLVGLGALWLRDRRGIRVWWSVPLLLALMESLVRWPWPVSTAAALEGYPVLLQSLDVVGACGVTFMVFSMSSAVYAVARPALGLPPVRRAPVVSMALLLNLLNVGYGVVAMADAEDTARLAPRLRVGVLQTHPREVLDLPDRPELARRWATQYAELEPQPVDLLVLPTVTGPASIRGRVPLVSGPWLDARGEAHATVAEQGNDIALRGGGESWIAVRDARVGFLLNQDARFNTLARYGVQNDAQMLVALPRRLGITTDSEMERHLASAVLRAVELRRSVLWASANGPSALIEPTGRITRRTPPNARANLVAQAPLLTEQTLQARFGPWVEVLIVMVVGGWGVTPLIGRRRRVASQVVRTV